MKYPIIILILAGLVGGLWFGVGTMRRNAMLDSGRPVLLVNRDLGVYTYSDLIEREDITRSLKVIGYADELSADELATVTADLRFFSAVNLGASDNRGVQLLTSSQVIPTAQEQQRWTAALTSLTATQSALCGNLPDAATVQYCLSRHITYQAVALRQTASVCDALYVPDQKAECARDIALGRLEDFVDANANQIIDVFEDMAVPFEQRTNTRNLPIVNPTE